MNIEINIKIQCLIRTKIGSVFTEDTYLIISETLSGLFSPLASAPTSVSILQQSYELQAHTI